MRPAGPDVDVVFGVAVTCPEREAARGLAQGVLDHVGRQAHPLAVDPRAGLGQDLARLVMHHIQTSVLEDMQDTVEQFFQLILGEHVEAYSRVFYIIRPHPEVLLSVSPVVQ